MDHLQNAVKKCVRNYGKQWCGYLIPKEILALSEIVKIDSHYLDVAIHWKRSGVSGGRWVYFDSNKRFEKLLERYNHD